MSLNFIEMLLDKVSSRDCESPFLKKCIGSQSLLGNNMSISSQYQETPFQVEKIRSAHVPIKRSPLNASMNPSNYFASSDFSLVNHISKSFPPPKSFFRNYCHSQSDLEIFREIAGYEISNSTQIFERIAETVCYITDSYLNKMVNTSENYSACTKQTIGMSDLSKKHPKNNTSHEVDPTNHLLTDAVCSDIYSCDNPKSNNLDCSKLSVKPNCSVSDLSRPDVKNSKANAVDMIDMSGLSKIHLKNNTSEKVDLANQLLTNAVCSVNYSCDNPKSTDFDCSKLSAKLNCCVSDLSCPDIKNSKINAVDMIPKIIVEIPVKKTSAQKKETPVLICNVTLNQELTNRKNKEIQKRSRKWRRRQKKNKKANLEMECNLKSDTKSKLNNQVETMSDSSKMCNAVKNKNINCDALHDVKDETEKAESVQIILPNVSSFFISVESTDGDSDWDESCDSEWLDDISEFECTGLNLINLTAPKTNTVLLTIPSSHKDDDIEILRLNAVLHRVNREWNEATKELKGKLKCSTKVSFAPDDELVEVLPVEMYDRKGEWEMYALERLRFKRRIDELEKIISPCLSKEHRAKVYKKLFKADL